MTTPLPGRRLSELDFAENAIGAELYGNKDGLPVRVIAGGALGVATLGADSKMPADQIPVDIAALREDLAADGVGQGADLVAFPDAVAPAFLKTTSDLINGDRVSLLRGIPRALHAGIRDGSNTTHLSGYINELFAATNVAKRGDLYFPDGTFLLDAPLTYKTRTRIAGAGSARSKLLVDPAAFPTTGGIYQILRNENYAATSITDEYITLQDLALDYSTLTGVSGGGSHAFTARMARKVRVLNCDFTGGENATALLACDDTLTQGCTSTDPENCGFDHWDGFTIARVISCTVRRVAASFPDQGIMFTADPSTGAGRSGSQAIAIGNHVNGIDAPSATGILVNAVNAGNAIQNVTISGNVVSDCAAAIVLQGNIANAVIAGNPINGGGQAVVVKADTSGSPDNVLIQGNPIRNPFVTVGDVAVISTAGTKVNVLGNTITGTSFPYAIWQQASGIVKGNNFGTGSAGRILDGSAGAALIEDDDNTAMRHDFKQKLRAPGLLFGADTADANLLDDYEEGEWTPVDASGAALVFTSTGGRYTKIGRQVTAQCQLTFPSTADAAAILLGGLPFVTPNSATLRVGGVVNYANAPLAEQATTTQGATTFTIRDSAGTGLTNSQMSLKVIWLTFVYQVD